MNTHCASRITLMLGLALSLAAIVSAQGTTNTPNKTLVVNGKAIPAGVRQINGRSYIDVEILAQATNGVVTVEPNRVVLTMPGAGSAAAPRGPASNSQELSRTFAVGAIGEVSEMREWSGAIGAMVTYGLAISGTWAQDYRNRVQTGLTQLASSATTDGDRNALQLLTTEFDNLAEWSNEIFTARQNLNGAKTVDPNALSNDSQLAKITNCSHSLEGMLISGTFSDDGGCR
ncbi:MAG TPA: hypothetical protein VGR97_04165 [Candidatus Acidoferrales bacterium]|nr:hypothetical protein [Candidatus Acidoferrales bacterium]